MIVKMLKNFTSIAVLLRTVQCSRSARFQVQVCSRYCSDSDGSGSGQRKPFVLDRALQDIDAPFHSSLLKRRTILHRDDKDILSQTIASSSSLAEVYKVIGSNEFSTATPNHTCVAFRTIVELVRQGDPDKDMILKSPQFNKLCSIALKRIDQCSIQNAFDIINSLTNLKISPRVTLMSAALQILRQQLNRLDLTQLIHLDFILGIIGKQGHSNDDSRMQIPLVEALKLAVPLVVEVRISNNEIDFDDVEQLTACMRMAAFRNINPEKLNTLMVALSSRMRQMNLTQCFWTAVVLTKQYLIQSADFDTDLAETMLEHCMSRLAKPSSSDTTVSLTMMADLIEKSLSGPRHESTHYYHREFFNEVARRSTLVVKSSKAEKTARIIASLSRADHFNYNLLDEYAKFLVDNEQDYIENNKVGLSSVLRAYTAPSRYIPSVGWEPLLKTLLHPKKTDILLNSTVTTQKILLPILSNLAILGHYPRDLLDTVLSDNLKGIYGTFLERRQKSLVSNCLRTLNIGISCDHHGLSDKDVTRFIDLLRPYTGDAIDFLDKARQHDITSKVNLRAYIETAFGGEHFVRNNVWTAEGHYINHVIVMRKGDYPVAVGSEEPEVVNRLEELQSPVESRM